MPVCWLVLVLLLPLCCPAADATDAAAVV